MSLLQIRTALRVMDMCYDHLPLSWKDDDNPSPIQGEVPSYEPLTALDWALTERPAKPMDARERPSNESNPEDYQANLETMALHMDQFNAVLLQLLSSCRSGGSRWTRRGQLRNGIRSSGAKLARRQFTILRRCINEAFSTSHETIDGQAFMRLVLQHHPYRDKISMVAALLSRLAPDLVRSVAKRDLRIISQRCHVRDWTLGLPGRLCWRGSTCVSMIRAFTAIGANFGTVGVP